MGINKEEIQDGRPKNQMCNKKIQMCNKKDSDVS